METDEKINIEDIERIAEETARLGFEHCGRTKQRESGRQRQLVNRLSRIEGQVRGIKKMLNNSAYCIDILVQAAAVNAAMSSFCKELLGEHIATCVTDDIRAGKTETVDELVSVLQKLIR